MIIREISEMKRAQWLLQDSRLRLRDLSGKLESVREEERTRVAREIHDELGQALTALSLDLSWLLKQTPKESRVTRARVRSMLRTSKDLIQGVRRIASELRPPILDDLGLIPAIEWQLAEFQKRTGIQATLKCERDGVLLDPQRSTAIFRIVQEALTNVIRHAKASRVEISLKVDDDSLLLNISDNGRGISYKEVSKPSSLGLIGMTERMQRLGGEFKIAPKSRGTGTRLDVFLPLRDVEKLA